MILTIQLHNDNHSAGGDKSTQARDIKAGLRWARSL